MRTWVIVVAIAVAAFGSGACAARSGGPAVPRPFPGATLPPGSDVPVRTEPSTAPPGAAAVTPVPSVGNAWGAVVTTALALRGIPYRSGGTDPTGFDCSGLVQYVFRQHGVVLPREVRDQYRTGDEVKLTDVQAGDLLFFETKRGGASHVGLALGDGRFVHAPSSNGVVRVERYNASYWASRFVGARRVKDVGKSTGDGLVTDRLSER